MSPKLGLSFIIMSFNKLNNVWIILRQRDSEFEIFSPLFSELEMLKRYTEREKRAMI
jgi:hypothetical protein